MDTGIALSSQPVHIVCQFLRISAPFHKSNHASASLTVAIYQLRQFLPYRILPFSGRHIRKRACHHKLHFLFHGRSDNGSRFRRQVGRRRGKRLDGSRQPDTLQRLTAKPIQPGYGQHEMGSPFGVDQGVKLVQYDGLRRGQYSLPRFAREHQIQGFRCGDKNMRRIFDHPLPVSRRRVPCTDGDFNFFSALPRKPVQRPSQIFPDIRSQRFQRRDIDQMKLPCQRPLSRLPRKPVDKYQKGRQRLAGTRRGRHQCILSSRNGGPGLLLNRRRFSKRSGEPVCRIFIENTVHICHCVSSFSVTVRHFLRAVFRNAVSGYRIIGYAGKQTPGSEHITVYDSG